MVTAENLLGLGGLLQALSNFDHSGEVVSHHFFHHFLTNVFNTPSNIAPKVIAEFHAEHQ